MTTKIDPALHNISLAQALEAITKVADHPLKFSIEEYAIVFSQKTPDVAHLSTRTFRVNPNTFVEGLQGVYAQGFGSFSTSSGGAGGGGGGGGGGGANGQSGGLFTLPSVDITGNGGTSATSGGAGGGGGGGGGGAGGAAGQGIGVPGVTITNATQNVQDTVRAYFTAAGVSMTPPNMIFFNDRTGVLLVRATVQELDIVQQAVEVLNIAPPQVTIEAKFAIVQVPGVKNPCPRPGS